MRKLSILLMTALVIGAGSALAQSQSHLTASGKPDAPAKIPAYMKTVQEWQAVAPTGGPGSSNNAKVQVVNLIGDPSKPGMYVQLLKVAPHVSIEAHHHAGDRTASVLQGAMMFGYGAKFDKTKLKVLSVGSVYTEPSGVAHFAATGDQGAVAELTGYGPTDTVYENAADDPTKKPLGK
jgi:anti-sigma factor ChrR (cupin superfamily)